MAAVLKVALLLCIIACVCSSVVQIGKTTLPPCGADNTIANVTYDSCKYACNQTAPAGHGRTAKWQWENQRPNGTACYVDDTKVDVGICVNGDCVTDVAAC
uniref:BTSP n=1 Tax=Argas monolakensis TaxID=34602 RepID=Q09JP0_ARGMO|nr:BTSP [Argas monolakensis]